MRYPFKELVDVATLQELTDELYAAAGIPSAIITTDGEILTASGWQRICTDFHRTHPLIEHECIQSDTTLHARLDAGDSFAMYTCPRGLVDGCVPVLIEGEHLANVFAGQLFLEPTSDVSEEFFRAQARHFGLDESAYIEAFREVPVSTEARFRLALSFLASLARSIASLGLGRLRELEIAAQLDAEKSRYRIVADNTYDWEFWLDPDGRVNYVSPSCERVSGYTTQDFHSDPEIMTRIIHADDLEGYRAHSHDALANRAVEEIAFRILRPDGEVRWIEHTCSPVFADDGLFLGTRGSNRDITERVKAEEAFRHMERRLHQSQKMESLGILAGGIAHDFNNLLMAVLGNADLALAALSPSAPGRENLLEITAGCRRAADLCNQMLAYSGRGRFVIEPLALNEVVQDMLDLLGSVISRKARLDLRLDEHVPLLLGDASQLSQVIMNLVINASEALGDEEGVIIVSLGETDYPSDHLEVTYQGRDLPGGRYITLSVADTGCGMDAETQDRLFDPFFTTKFTGRGLGLSAVQGIVRGHGGVLKLDSELGRGSTFTVLFPALENEATPSTSTNGGEAWGWKGHGTALLVDDEEAVRRVGKRMLESLGFQVLTASDGREALDVYRVALRRYLSSCSTSRCPIWMVKRRSASCASSTPACSSSSPAATPSTIQPASSPVRVWPASCTSPTPW